MGNGENLGDSRRDGHATGRNSEATPQGVMDFAPVVNYYAVLARSRVPDGKSGSGWGELKLRGVVSGQSRCHSAVTRCSTI